MHEPRSNITTEYLLLSQTITLVTFNSIIKRKLIFLEIINSIDGKYYMASKNHASIFVVESNQYVTLRTFFYSSHVYKESIP